MTMMGQVFSGKDEGATTKAVTKARVKESVPLPGFQGLQMTYISKSLPFGATLPPLGSQGP